MENIRAAATLEGINPTQKMILMAIILERGSLDWSNEQLAQFVGVSKVTIVKQLTPMYRKGLIQSNRTSKGRGTGIQRILSIPD